MITIHSLGDFSGPAATPGLAPVQASPPSPPTEVRRGRPVAPIAAPNQVHGRDRIVPVRVGFRASQLGALVIPQGPVGVAPRVNVMRGNLARFGKLPTTQDADLSQTAALDDWNSVWNRNSHPISTRLSI
jgi:hypothetical protein